MCLRDGTLALGYFHDLPPSVAKRIRDSEESAESDGITVEIKGLRLVDPMAQQGSQTPDTGWASARQGGAVAVHPRATATTTNSAPMPKVSSCPLSSLHVHSPRSLVLRRSSISSAIRILPRASCPVSRKSQSRFHAQRNAKTTDAPRSRIPNHSKHCGAPLTSLEAAKPRDAVVRARTVLLTKPSWLQGFRAGWTRPAAEDERSERIRWRLVGNAVSVPVAAWLARRLLEPGEYDASNDREVDLAERWPAAAWGAKGRRYTAEVSAWPVRTLYRGLHSFLRYAAVPLSVRVAAGFHARAQESPLAFEDGFLDDVAHHVDRMRDQERKRDCAA